MPCEVLLSLPQKVSPAPARPEQHCSVKYICFDLMLMFACRRLGGTSEGSTGYYFKVGLGVAVAAGVSVAVYKYASSKR